MNEDERELHDLKDQIMWHLFILWAADKGILNAWIDNVENVIDGDGAREYTADEAIVGTFTWERSIEGDAYWMHWYEKWNQDWNKFYDLMKEYVTEETKGFYL